eukprot:TRINITY_DN6139_c0_g1_i1.p1 TRINITY_DN6139_c0_g1~~TRINITY_DN6139_c0_g1_i1.p1  ORF type:complete len:225 (+),score=34.26 TRINITY_DN6139_c0_g1_i1:66-740(+)
MYTILALVILQVFGSVSGDLVFFSNDLRDINRLESALAIGYVSQQSWPGITSTPQDKGSPWINVFQGYKTELGEVSTAGGETIRLLGSSVSSTIIGGTIQLGNMGKQASGISFGVACRNNLNDMFQICDLDIVVTFTNGTVFTGAYTADLNSYNFGIFSSSSTIVKVAVQSRDNTASIKGNLIIGGYEGYPNDAVRSATVVNGGGLGTFLIMMSMLASLIMIMM